ncbi:MAG TPA: hypothetical protein VI818_02665 [Candidatus Thermoplasmatota archaeon]|nr:hypothetical protein [Candidatus Thermoplasmatota archaeon]
MEYVLIGGLAVMAWGQPRATMDVDALARLETKRIEALFLSCKGERLQFEVEDARDALRGEGHLTIFDLDSPYHVDVKVARTVPEVLQVSSGVSVEFEEGILHVASPEDTVAYKLLFGSPQDIADARSILVRQQARLDWATMLKTCVRLGVAKKLEGVLFEVGLREKLGPSHS